MRTAFLAAALLALPLTACDKEAARNSHGAVSGDGGATIPCAIGGAEAFKPVCTVERSTVADGIVLTLHHPDGGFRRLQVATDGRGVVAADGADAASVKIVSPGSIEVAVGEDRYRLPATVKGQADRPR